MFRQVSVEAGHAMIGQVVSDYFTSLFGSGSIKQAAQQKIVDAAARLQRAWRADVIGISAMQVCSGLR